jgi:hypothetical protein
LALDYPSQSAFSCSVLRATLDLQKAGVTGATVTAMAVRGLIERDAAARLSLTDEGREVLAALLLGRVPSR